MSSEMEEFAEEFQHLRPDYYGLQYPGDLPGDLGLITKRPPQRTGWRIGGATRWLVPIAAAAAVGLLATEVRHAITPAPMSPAIATSSIPQPSSAAISLPGEISGWQVNDAKIKTAAASAAKTNSLTAVDDSIPLWSDVDVTATTSSVSAGFPSESLILPALSDVQSEKAQAAQLHPSQSKS